LCHAKVGSLGFRFRYSFICQGGEVTFSVFKSSQAGEESISVLFGKNVGETRPPIHARFLSLTSDGRKSKRTELNVIRLTLCRAKVWGTKALVSPSGENVGGRVPPGFAPMIKGLPKKLYYQCEFQKSKTNPRMTWDIIRSALPTKLDQRTSPSHEVNGSITDKPLLFENKFNQFFFAKSVRN